MRVIVAGSRWLTLEEYWIVQHSIEMSGFDVTEVVSGGATGADQLGEKWAKEKGVLVKRFPVTSEEWRKHGKKAGPIRNRRMAEYGEGLVAVWDGESRGTRSMINEACNAGIKIAPIQLVNPRHCEIIGITEVIEDAADIVRPNFNRTKPFQIDPPSKHETIPLDFDKIP